METGTFQAPWSRLKRAISRVTRHRFPASAASRLAGKHTAQTLISLTFSSPRRSSVDLNSHISFDVPPVDPDHNEKVAINRLPTEILAEIFVLVCEASDLSDYSWIVCSHICSSWRHIALDTSHLWSHVVFSSSEWMRLCIQRSKSSLLIVEAGMSAGYPLVQTLVSETLGLADRIGRIRLRFHFLSGRLLTQLAGPFPMLTSLSIENNSFWNSPHIPFDPEVQPYPRMRTLSIRTNVHFLPPLPSQLVSLEITSADMENIGWDIFASALQPLVELEILTLQGFPVPSDPASVPGICLPNLRDLHLSASPAQCTQFIRTLLCPHMRRYDLDLWNVENIGEMFRTVLENLRRSPKSMFLHRKSGRSSDIECYHLPNYMDSGVYQHAIVGFAYADVRDLGAVTLDICFGWRLPLDDHELATIFTAVSEIALIDRIQWLLLVDWNTTPEGSWCTLLQRLVGLQTLVVSGAPASGLLWDLIKQMEGPSDDVALCPQLTEIEINTVDCCAGGWMPRRAHAQAPVNSYIDQDGSRFLEVLVCYLELRPIKLPKLKVTRCYNYTGAEIKLLRRLVGEVQWDGVGAIGTSYGSNGDEFGAMTINHNLLSSRSGYEALNLSEEERWKRQNWAHWGFRPSTRLSDRLYAHTSEADG